MEFDWGGLISAALPSVIQLGGGLLQNSLNEDEGEAKAKAKLTAEELAFQRALQLKGAAKPAGGGGGGGGGPFLGFTGPQKVAAMQAQGAQEQDSINAIINAYQRAVLR